MHRYGGLALWDYAAAAPYVAIDANPASAEEGKGARKDALYFSSHKFLGGVQGPGVLVAKRDLFVNPVPHGGEWGRHTRGLANSSKLTTSHPSLP